MLKKMTSLVLAGMMALSLAACGNPDAQSSSSPSADPSVSPSVEPSADPSVEPSADSSSNPASGTSLDLSAFYDEMFGTVFPDPNNAPSMMLLEGDMLDQSYPGLSDVATTQCLVYAPMMSAVAYEVALVEVSDPADVETVKAIFDTRIASQIEGGAFYPATVEVWQNNAEIVEKGNIVALFVGAEKDQMVELFNAAQ